MKPAVTRWLFLLFLFVVGSTSALAQGVTTAAISGSVSDVQGQPLPGATILAVHVPTGTQYGTVAREDGRFNLVNVQVGGPYTITTSFVGFQSDERTGVNLTLGQNLTLNLQLAESTAELGEVEIVGAYNPILNSDRTGAAQNISNEQIENLPTISRSIQDFARLVPQMSGTAGGSGVSVGGRNNRFNNIQIDGAVLNDVFGLAASGTPGGQASTQPISLDAIEQFNVSLAPYDVRQNGFTGALINAVTRRGTNQFEGSLYYYGRNESFVGDNQVGKAYGDFTEYQSGFRIGGPIAKNKAFFFVNGEIGKRDSPLDVGITGAGAGTTFGVDQTVMNQFVDVLKNKYGYDPGSFDIFQQERTNTKLFARLDLNLSNTHKLTLRHNYVDGIDDNLSRSNTSYFLANSNYEFVSTQNQTVAQLNSTFGSNLGNEFRLAYTRVRDHRETPGNPFPSVQVTLATGLSATAGTEQFSIGNRLDQDIIELENNLSYFLGKHTLTFGTHNEMFSFENGFFRNFYGRYQFNSLADFEAGKPSRYEYTYSMVNDPEPVAKFSVLQTGWYAQDDWQVTPELKVTAGVRADIPFFLDDPLYNPKVEEAFGLRTDEVPSGNILWSPRLGFNYSTAEKSTQVRGGVGIFSGRAPFVWLSNQYGNTGMDLARVLKTSNITFPFTTDINNQPRPGVTQGLDPVATAEINITDPNFKLPQLLRLNLAVDQQLPFGLVGTLEALYGKNLNEVYYQDLNLGPQASTDPNDGRPVWGTRTTGNSGFSVTSPRQNAAFTNVVYLTNHSEGYQYNLTAQIQRLPQDGLFGNLAYTYGRAKDLQAMSSSQASSNWGFSLTPGNPNDFPLTTSNYELRHRIIGSLSYRFDFGRFFGYNGLATTATLFYEGRAGSPYTIVYNGDVNVDTRTANDIIYVPSSRDEIVLVRRDNTARVNNPAPDADYDALFAWLNEYGVSEYAGEILERNVLTTPWSHQFDLRLAQEIPTIRGQRFELTVDILNVSNLLNSDWGIVKTVTNQSYTGLLTPQGVTADNKVQYELSKTIRESAAADTAPYTVSDLASRWQLQLGLRYTF